MYKESASFHDRSRLLLFSSEKSLPLSHMHTTIPLRVEDSIYKDQYQIKLALDSGNFYIFEHYIIGEVHEGQHIDWADAKVLLERVYEHFGTSDIDMSYISNRINSYSVQPKDWLNFYRERHKVKSISVVAYNKIGLMNIALERLFSKAPYRKFINLESAVAFVQNSETKTPNDTVND